MMKRICLAAFLMFSTVVSYASPVISIEPVSQGVELGSQLTVNINISGLDESVALGTYDLSVGFDPALLSYSGITFGDQLDLFGLGDMQIVTPASGSVGIYELSFESAGDLNNLQVSSFLLASLTFNTLAAGSNSPLILSIITLGDALGEPIPAVAHNATVSVISAVPIPGAVWLFSSALIFLGALNRRTKHMVVCSF